ncbi:MAG: hypothetical protein HOQ34_07855 [Gemmatimonadaceae bacterium]|nr:hypothetical protein [Gemmatimonadaceae bacterium]
MPDSITPALTPEEGTTLDADVGGGVRIARLEHGVALSIDTGDDQHMATLAYIERPYAAAAICLAGQPFGFTWEDVDLLQRLADGEEHLAYWHAGKFAEIAARIAALLPPRTT